MLQFLFISVFYFLLRHHGSKAFSKQSWSSQAIKKRKECDDTGVKIVVMNRLVNGESVTYVAILASTRGVFSRSKPVLNGNPLLGWLKQFSLDPHAILKLPFY